MKKTRKGKKTVRADGILPECDFSHGSHNTYAAQYAADSVVVAVLDPDVAAAFPSSGEAKKPCALWRDH
jgi:hypothetical protein